MYPYVEEPDYWPGNCFSLSNALTNLKSLTLSSWPLLLKDGCSIANCLPNLVHASVHLHTDLVIAFTLCNQVKVLSLILVDPVPLPRNHSVQIMVKSSSQLRKLELCGPAETLLDLRMEKPGVQLRCSNVSLRNVQVASFENDT